MTDDQHRIKIVKNNEMCVCKSNDKKLIKDYEIGDILIFCSVCGLYKHLPYKQSPSSGNVIVSKIINNNTIEVRL